MESNGDLVANGTTQNLTGILAVAPNGTVSNAIPSALLLEDPQGVAVNANGNVSCFDSGNDWVENFTAAGAENFDLLSPKPQHVYGMKFDTNGNLFAAGYETDEIYEISPNGTSTEFASVVAPMFLAEVPSVPEPAPEIAGALFACTLALRRQNRPKAAAGRPPYSRLSISLPSNPLS